MSEKERLVELLLESEPIKERDLDDGWGDNEISDIADYLLENGVVVLPCKINLPDELYRYMFDDDRQPIPVKCKVVKITGYGFTLKHPADGREWEYKYNSLGYTVFLTKEETDERIKALKGGGDDCSQCPYGNIVYKSGSGGCVNRCRKDALDLINRQKAEIERLTDLSDQLGNDIDIKLNYIYDLEEKIETAKSEAIKEFAEQLIRTADGDDEYGTVFVFNINDLVKEMTEVQK